ncbi:MAG: helix-turn-helix domain-containing protein [Opitutales bacterium]
MSKDPSRIPRSCFSTESFPPQDHFSAWREGISSIFQLERTPGLDCGESFHARLEVYQFPQMGLSQVQSTRARYVRNRHKISQDGVDMILVQLFVKGGVQFGVGKETRYGRAGDIVLFDLAQTNDNINSDFCHVTAGIARERVEAVIPDIARYHGAILPRKDPSVSLLRSHLASTFDLAHALHPNATASVEEATLVLLQAAIRGLAAPPVVGAAGHTSLAYQVRRYIRRHLGDPDLSPERIAGLFGLSRARLYRVMQPVDGVAAYIREQRLRACRRDIENPALGELTIGEIAYRRGFRELRSFNRLFRQRFSATPTEMRKQLVDPSCQDEKALPERFEYEAWIREFSS